MATTAPKRKHAGGKPRDLEKRELFCREYVIDRNGARAAAAAGFGPGGAKQRAYLLLEEPAVQRRIKELTKRALDRADITAERVMLELGRLAFADVRHLFDDKGELRPVHDLPDDVAATIAGLDVQVETSEKGSVITRTHKIRRSDKVQALGVLARHFKLVGTEIDETVGVAMAVAERMERAAERLKRMRPDK